MFRRQLLLDLVDYAVQTFLVYVDYQNSIQTDRSRVYLKI